MQYVGRAPGLRPPGLVPAGVVALGFLLGVIALALTGAAPTWLPAGYMGLSLVTLLFYSFDKARPGRQLADLRSHFSPARSRRRLARRPRRPPQVRHKTTKQPFVTVDWLTVGVNCLALAWLVRGMPTAIV